ncbi:hypothetical protein [Streptomyces sp. NPDC087317]|uniref:hypothetical protein n=1 Tax=Streptomyces sp. NPDC087317 TaxID=3365784 RepID=UPI003805C86E
MPSTDEVLEQIDSAVDDWTVSADAMRCTPAPAPTPAGPPSNSAAPELPPVPVVPVVQFTGPLAARALAARALVALRLVDRHGLTPGTATSAVRAATNGEPTPHHDLVIAEAEAAAAEATQHLAHDLAALISAFQTAATAMKQFSKACRAADGYVAAYRKPHRSRDRPAWQSPYGPPARRR